MDKTWPVCCAQWPYLRERSCPMETSQGFVNHFCHFWVHSSVTLCPPWMPKLPSSPRCAWQQPLSSSSGIHSLDFTFVLFSPYLRLKFDTFPSWLTSQRHCEATLLRESTVLPLAFETTPSLVYILLLHLARPPVTLLSSHLLACSFPWRGPCCSPPLIW